MTKEVKVETEEEKDNRIFRRMTKHKEEVEKLGYRVIYLSLFGSQNYGLDDSNSDIDTRAIVMPRLEDIIHSKNISFVLTLDNNEKVDVKDINTMFTQFKKQNITYLEALYTDYCMVITDYYYIFERLKDYAEDISNMDRIRRYKSMYGMAKQKFSSFNKAPENASDEVKRLRYNPKDVMHLHRILYMLELEHRTGCSLKDVYNANNFGKRKEDLLMFRQGIYPKEEVVMYCIEAMDKITHIVDELLKEESLKKDLKEKKNKAEELLEDSLKRVYTTYLKEYVPMLEDFEEIELK